MTISGNTTLSGLSDGSHSLIVYAKDTVGNTEASEMVSFTVETQLSEPFPLWTIGAIVMIAGVVVALLIYFTKVKKTTEKVQISFFWFCYNFSEFLTFTNLQYADSMKW